MAAGEFYIVYIKRLNEISYETVKEKMDLSKSWYRINETIWILYTTSNADKWYIRLVDLAKDSGNLFICKLDMSNSQGWMNRKFWDWVEEHQPEKDKNP